MHLKPTVSAMRDIARNVVYLRPAENDRYDLAIKNALVAAGGTGFTYPPCDAEEWQSGANYPGGTNVSYNGYIWEVCGLTFCQYAGTQ